MPDGAGIIVAPVAARSVAGLASFRDRDRFARAMQAELGVAVPETARFVTVGAVILACLAPSRFVASGARGSGLPARLAACLAGVGAVTDQSDLWSSVRLDGPGVREVLARIVPIDLDPLVFAVGGIALTRSGHLDVRLCRMADDGYEIAATRSFQEDLRHAIAHAREPGRRDAKL